MSKLEEIKPGCSLAGISSEGTVSVLNVEWHGTELITLTYKTPKGVVDQRVLGRESESGLEVKAGNVWSFDADPALFKLASEAKRIRLAYLFDPYLAVHTSKIEPLPHQIEAVYDTMLGKQPLRFLLADDPGAGKTIMAGLLIKELMVRGDVKRCLIVSPGGLAEQWQDELHDKFQLDFEIITRDRIEMSRTGNPFEELDFVIARLDQLSRFEDLQEKATVKGWDLIVVDEAHKMAAHVFGNDVKETKRYKLGKKLRDHTRHFLLMSATPHNGKNEDFQLFLQLLDRDRFEGKFRTGVPDIDISDICRRCSKEDLLKFDETRLFPERIASTKEFTLSPEERHLYEAVTAYVKEEFNKAEAKGEKKKNVVGFALTVLQRRLASSPEAIYQSLKRRREKLEKKRHEYILIRDGKVKETGDAFYEFSEEDIQDIEDNPDSDSENFEEEVVDQATASESIPELESEIERLKLLEKEALKLRNSNKDSKWDALKQVLSQPDMFEKDRTRRKLIIFTEHKDTLTYIENQITKLLGKSNPIVVIHGGISREKRKFMQDRFTQDKNVSILVATDAAGEGINLQRAHLMINYDIPWNPNRIEQRFGRIHRIGQRDVCILWNLIASETREGDVFKVLFEKLEEQRRVFKGKVFDVLGNVFRDQSLKDLILESIRYGEDPQRRVELQQKVRGVLNKENIERVLSEHAIAETSLSKSQIQALREEMERANARRLQPHFISSFFKAAFTHLNGIIVEREAGRYEIKQVPSSIRQANYWKSRKVLSKYERVCFDKDLINLEGKPTADFLCPGNPLFDTVLETIIEKYGGLLRKGAVLVEKTGKLESPALLYYLDHEVYDDTSTSDGHNTKVSEQLLFLFLPKEGRPISAGYAPYLDCEPPKNFDAVAGFLKDNWLKQDQEKAAVDYITINDARDDFTKVKLRRSDLIEKTTREVKARLMREINYWDTRANDLKEKELAGKTIGGLNSGIARKFAEDLDARLKIRLEELAKAGRLINKTPFVVGGALIIPEKLVLSPKDISDFTADAEARKKIEKLAVEVVLNAEKALGRLPEDKSSEKLHWDVESLDPKTKQLYFIEVKGRQKGADTITVSTSEIKAGKNVADDDPERYILAVVEIVGDSALEPRYIRNPYKDLPTLSFEMVGVNFDIKKLLARSEGPR